MDKRNERFYLSDEEMSFLCTLRNKNINDYKRPRDKERYRIRITESEKSAILNLRKFKEREKVMPEFDFSELKRLKKKEEELNEAIDALKIKGGIELHEINPIKNKKERQAVPIILYSDWHIDEVFTKESTLGLNEYNPEIAQHRADEMFCNTCKLISHQQLKYNMKEVVLALLGDFISGWIHDELIQTNSGSPQEAIRTARNLLLSGMKYMHENLNVDKIYVVCIGGNHSRTTKKVQYINFADVSLEYGMYRDIKDTCKLMGLDKFEFIIPKAEMAVIEMFGKRMLFAHGHQFKFSGGVGGIYPSMNKWVGNSVISLKIDMAFIGHWHHPAYADQCIVNGSLKGYDPMALSKQYKYYDPVQIISVLDSEYGFSVLQQVFPF